MKNIFYTVYDFFRRLFRKKKKPVVIKSRKDLLNQLKKENKIAYAVSTSNRAQRRHHLKMTGEKIVGANVPYRVGDKKGFFDR